MTEHHVGPGLSALRSQLVGGDLDTVDVEKQGVGHVGCKSGEVTIRSRHTPGS